MSKHERRVVGHASGWQEQMSTCVCGNPWPCVALTSNSSNVGRLFAEKTVEIIRLKERIQQLEIALRDIAFEAKLEDIDPDDCRETIIKKAERALGATHETCDARDATRYRLIRTARVGAHGCCEIWNVAYTGSQLDEAIDAVAHAPKASEPRAWHFDRYRNGRLMAEGVTVHTATETEAWEKAESLKRQFQWATDELRLSKSEGEV